MPNLLHNYSVTSVLQPYMLVFYTSFMVTLILTPLMRFLAHRNPVLWTNPMDGAQVHTQPIVLPRWRGHISGVGVAGRLPFPSRSSPITPIRTTFSTKFWSHRALLLGAARWFVWPMDDVYGLNPKSNSWDN